MNINIILHHVLNVGLHLLLLIACLTGPAKTLVLEDLVQTQTIEKVLSKKKVGIFLGSFDPVHKGHEDVARLPIQKGLCDYVIVYPAWGGDSFKKRVDVVLRLDMLFSVFKDDPHVIVTRMPPKELQETLTMPLYANEPSMIPRFTGLQFVGVMGSDTALAYKDSKLSQRFLSGIAIQKKYENHTVGGICALPANTFIVVKRKGDDLSVLNNQFSGRSIVAILESDKYSTASSTQVKKNLKEGKAIEELVSPGVAKIIQENELYR